MQYQDFEEIKSFSIHLVRIVLPRSETRQPTYIWLLPSPSARIRSLRTRSKDRLPQLAFKARL